MRATKIKLTSEHVIIIAPFDYSNENWVRCFTFFRDIFSPKLLFSTFCKLYTPNLIKVDVTFFWHILADGTKVPAGFNVAMFYSTDPSKDPDDPTDPSKDPDDPTDPPEGPSGPNPTKKTYTARGIQGLYPAFQGKGLSRPMHQKYLAFYKEHSDSNIFIKALIISGMEYRQLARYIAKLYPSPDLPIPNEIIIEIIKFIVAHGGEISAQQPFALEPEIPITIDPALVERMIKMKMKGDPYLNFYCRNVCPEGTICSVENCCVRKRGLVVVIPLSRQNIRATALKILINKMTKLLFAHKL